jgi:SAM-dependent methyltransferase
METNGAAHLMRAARQSGITTALQEKQHTLQELCESLSIEPTTTKLLLDGLVAIGFVEQYEDDFALARAGHLLCQYDEDLGDQRWEMLVGRLNDSVARPASDDGDAVELLDYRNRLAATQWIHTAAAMQAAEMLDVGGETSGTHDATQGIRILDLGCGSAVWSCAMAHRDADSSIVAVDQASALQAAANTAQSIGLQDRFESLESDPRSVNLGERTFDLAILAQVLSGYSDSEAAGLLEKAAAALKPGGRLVAPDYYVGPGRAGLKESLSRLSIHLTTPRGRVRDLQECQQMFLRAGLESIQFTFLAASEAGLGMIVASKP